MRNSLLVLLTALIIDEWFGEPPNRWHPVVWMGTFITRMRQHAPKQNKLLYGGLITFGGSGIVWLCAAFAVRVSRRLPFPLNILVQAWLLKTTFSLRGLDHAAAEVETALYADDLSEARRLLSWHLVSRDTTTLDASQVAAAAIESVAENTSDGIVAPLFWYGVGGLPAALTYRYLQTCDSILGYRDAEREWLGKVSARTDDLLNLIPARLTALVFIALRPRAWRVWRRDARLTASPNAGHPMSAMAGILDRELIKLGHYTLNAGRPLPDAVDLKRARRSMAAAVALFVLGLFILLRATHDPD